MPLDVRERIVLMVSEIVTNAIVHAHSAVEILTDRGATTIRIAITDTGAGNPTLRNPSPLDTHGRGLHIVEALSDQWGAEQTPHSKTVWFAVEL